MNPQTGVEAVKQIAPNTYVIILLVVFISERVINLVLKGVQTLRNGNGKEKKDDTQRVPCLQNPMFSGPWDAHKQETHDTKLTAGRVEGGMSKLLLESTKQTNELQKQTTEQEKQTNLLEKIQRNGSKKENV